MNGLLSELSFVFKELSLLGLGCNAIDFGLNHHPSQIPLALQHQVSLQAFVQQFIN